MELPPDPSNELLLEEACKLKFAIGLLDMLTKTGHRTLLFSTSLKILNYIQSMIGEKVRLYFILWYSQFPFYNIFAPPPDLFINR